MKFWSLLFLTLILGMCIEWGIVKVYREQDPNVLREKLMDEIFSNPKRSSSSSRRSSSSKSIPAFTPKVFPKKSSSSDVSRPVIYKGCPAERVFHGKRIIIHTCP